MLGTGAQSRSPGLQLAPDDTGNRHPSITQAGGCRCSSLQAVEISARRQSHRFRPVQAPLTRQQHIKFYLQLEERARRRYSTPALFGRQTGIEFSTRRSRALICNAPGR